MKYRVYNIQGLNLKLSPFLTKEGELLSSVNTETSTYGAKKKRSGYISYLGTPDNSQVDSLLNWTKGDGTQFWNYRVSGGKMFYSTQGTGDWTVCGNGTFTSGAPVTGAVLNETFIVGDGTANTRHTTNGTSFTDSSGAPKGQFLAQGFNRIFIGGTGSTLTYSVTGDPTNWATTGTSDSSSLTIPGAGKINQVFYCNDRINVSKNSNKMFRWDSYSLSQVPTNQGLSSPQSLAEVEDFWFWLNRNGIQSYSGDRPKLASSSVERQIYNEAGVGISGTVFDNAPGVTHRYKYLCSVGTVADDITQGTVNNCIQVYDYQNDIWGNYSFAHKPTAFLSYKDASGSQQLIFGDASGQCYKTAGTATSDNGSTINAYMEGVIHLGAPESEKDWSIIWAFFNPGAQAKVQVAMSNVFTGSRKVWTDLGDCSSGVAEFKFPAGSSSNLLFWRVYEASHDARFEFYGFTVEATIIDRK